MTKKSKYKRRVFVLLEDNQWDDHYEVRAVFSSLAKAKAFQAANPTVAFPRGDGSSYSLSRNYALRECVLNVPLVWGY